MKSIKMTILVLILCQSLVQAQETNSITVIGETDTKSEIERYIVNVEFSEVVGDTYRNIKAKTANEIVKEFAAALSKVNIDFSRFEQDETYRMSYGYFSSRLYFYKTTSKEEVERILTQRMEGATNIKVDIIAKELTYEQIGKLNADAIDDARNTATLIAENVGRTIGKIIQIEVPQSNKYKYYNTAEVKEPSKYYVKVVFALE